MSFAVATRPTNAKSPPSDEVHFDVEIDESQCGAIADGKIKQRLSSLKENGISLPIHQIITYSGIHYKDKIKDNWGYGQDYARIRHAWDNLTHTNPHAVYRQSKGVNKLVFDKIDGTLQGTYSELLGVGVGLLVAKKIYDIKYRFWCPTLPNSVTDYKCELGKSRTISIEVRARFNRKGWSKAIKQTHNKLKGVRDFNYACGILFAPRNSPCPRLPDICIVDPQKYVDNDIKYLRYRSLLRHYANFFSGQGQNFRPAADRMRELADASNNRFSQYLQRGDVFLRDSIMHRTAFTVGGVRFRGTAWEGTLWPSHLTKVESDTPGVFHHCIHHGVIELIREGRLIDLSKARFHPDWFHLAGRTYVLMEDGTALRWSPN